MIKIWYFLCIFICLYSVSILIDERYKVVYVLENRTELVDYIGCFDLKYIYPNKIDVDLSDFGEDLLNYLRNLGKYFDSSKLEKYILHLNSTTNYLIYKDHVCLLYNASYFLDDLKNIFRLKIYALKNDTFDLIQLNAHLFSSNIKQLVVLNTVYPYSNCRDEKYSKFHCLNDCFKTGYRLSKYFYRPKETGRIQLNYTTNRSIVAHESRCFEECKHENCKLVYFFDSSFCKSKTTIFRSYPTISKLSFVMQLIALVGLILKISFFRIIAVLTYSKDNLKATLLCLRLLAITATVICCTFLCDQLISDFRTKVEHPFRKEIRVSQFVPEPLSVVLCVPVLPIINQNEYENISISKLEKLTDRLFNETLKEIYLEYQSKKIAIDWRLMNKVLFTFYSRCFQIKIDPKEPKFQSLLAISRIIIQFKHVNYTLFLLTDNEAFSSKSCDLYSDKFIKRSYRRILNCVNYGELNLNCSSRANCVDKCIFERYLNNTSEISLNYIIVDKDHLPEQQWKNVVLNFDHLDIKFYFYRKKCEQEFPLLDCSKSNFEIDIKFESDKELIIQLDLYYDVISIVEETPSVYKLILDLLSVQSVLIGLNLFKLLHAIYLLTKRSSKIYFPIIYLLCLIGFIYQIYYIFNEIVNDDLIYSQYYEVLNSVRMPAIIFCFRFNHTHHTHLELTGNHLKAITNDMRMENVFSEIRFLNGSNEWATLKPSYDRTDPDFESEIFFFLQMKCFKLKLKIVYDPNRFHFADTNDVMEIFLNRSFIHEQGKDIYFVSQIEGTLQFSKLIIYNFLNSIGTYNYLIKQELFEIIRNDKFNFIKNPLALLHGQNDLNDVDEYLNKLKKNFYKAHRRRTLNLPLEEETFNDKIDDHLFEKYFDQVQRKIDERTPINSNYKRLSIKNYPEIYGFNASKPDFTFSLVFFKKVINFSTFERIYQKLQLIFII